LPHHSLPVSEKISADHLNAVGYATAAVGKWRLGSADRFHPQERGFDEFFGFLGGAHSYFPVVGDGVRRGRKSPANEKEYLAEDIGEAQDLSEQHPEKVQKLQAAWDLWNQSNIPPLWGGGRKR
jgi:arylsulfatase A-like enzyme